MPRRFQLEDGAVFYVLEREANRAESLTDNVRFGSLADIGRADWRCPFYARKRTYSLAAVCFPRQESRFVTIAMGFPLHSTLVISSDRCGVALLRQYPGGRAVGEKLSPRPVHHDRA